jgi:hypothetical protein
MDKLKLIVKSRRVYFPTLRLPIVGAGVSLPFDFSIRLPSLEGLDLGARTKSIVAMSLVVSGLVIAGAIYFAIRGIDPAPVWPDAATYDASRAQNLGQEEIGVGEDLDSDVQEGTMTLQLNIGGARIESIKFSDMSIGKASGLTDAISITSSAGNILCENLQFIDVEATDFSMATSTAYTFNVATTTADGLSISPTLSSDPIKYAFGSTRGSLNVPEVSGGTFDRIIISSNATSTVGLISFERVKAFGAGITVEDVNCGTITIEGTDADESVYGDGSGIDSASFTIADTVKVQSATLIGNVERPVSVK